jgi:hypothetical protein
VVREIVKLAALAAVILIAAALIALFASGYISAFKPGGTKEAAGEHVVGGSSSISGGTSVVSTPVPSPSPPPMQEMEEAMQQQQRQQPFPESPPVQPLQPLQEPVEPAFMPGPAMPPMEPSQPYATPPATWFEPRIIQDRPGMPPFAGPTAMPFPPVGQPVPQEPSSSESPFVLGWMQIIQRFVTILPYLFPGIIPIQTWWPQGL